MSPTSHDAGSRGTSPPTNLPLLGRMRSGEAAAWAEFDRFHRRLILSWARGLGCDEALAEDICQEAMVSLLRVLPNFEHNGRPGGFHALLKTLVRSRAVDALRQRRARDGRDAAAQAIATEPAAPVPDIPEDAAWMRTLIRRACERTFERLDSTTYRAFCLYAVEGVPAAETARRVDVDRVATVYQQKSRVLQAVRAAMRDILRELGDPELRDAAAKLRGAEVVRLLAEFVSDNPDVRLTGRAAAAAGAPDRIALARRALELCGDRADGPWLAAPAKGRVEPLGAVGISIGSRDADVRVDWPGVSGRHCLLTPADGAWTVSDQGSRNGTLINGRRVESAELVDGAVLTLGEGHLVFLAAPPRAGRVKGAQEKKHASA